MNRGGPELVFVMGGLFVLGGYVTGHFASSPKAATIAWSLGGLLMFVGVVASMLHWVRSDELSFQRRTGGKCPDCGYDLRGNVSGRCPECGKRIGDD